MFTFCKSRWARRKKTERKSRITKVTKIPETKRRKYGMNKKQSKIKNQSCISTEKSIKSLKKTKTAKANLFFFSKNHHHMNMIKMTGLKICNTTRESKREKNVASPNRKIHCYIIHTIKFIWHRVQSFCFSKKMLFFHWIYFQWRGIKGKILCHPLAISPCPPHHIFFFFAFDFKKHMKQILVFEIGQ